MTIENHIGQLVTLLRSYYTILAVLLDDNQFNNHPTNSPLAGSRIFSVGINTKSRYFQLNVVN